MLKTRRAVAHRVADHLIALEQKIDGALIDTAHLQVAAIEGRREAKLPLHAGQDGLEQLTTATLSLIAARKAVHDAHLAFRDVQDNMRIGPIAFGDYGDTPREYVAEGATEQPLLAVVRDAA